LEAAEEIVRQLRLRDIGGIIVIDFIDMVLESNRDLVLRRLVECLSRDRTKHQVAEVTSLGLVQMTRKKLGLGLLEAFSEPCDTCAGRGIVVHHEPIHRHRNDAPSRGKRKSGSQQSQQTTQAHAITDESRSAMAKIAASTIPGTAEHADATEPAAQKSEPKSENSRNARSQRNSRQAREDRSTRDDRSARDDRPARDSSAAKQEQRQVAVKPAAEDLLGSVLDALPPAPEAGTRRRTSRRVSTAAILAETGDIVGVASVESTTET
ncbi:MAG: ribonuclease E/G, partial [Actinomycetales bacterium]|nr:ribonuclease E/G [Actinomycetales bacterium]